MAPPSAWISAEQLAPCGPDTVGVKGIPITGDIVYAANTSRGLLVRIPVASDGFAGSPSGVAGDATNDCDPDELSGMDGIALDVYGMVYAMLVLQNRLVRIDPSDGSVETILTGADGIHNPASLTFGTQDGDREDCSSPTTQFWGRCPR